MSDPMSFRSLTIATPKLKNLTRLEKLIPHRNGFLNAKMKRLMLDDVKTANFEAKIRKIFPLNILTKSRSEERRVGKEGRSKLSTYHIKKKMECKNNDIYHNR